MRPTFGRVRSEAGRNSVTFFGEAMRVGGRVEQASRISVRQVHKARVMIFIMRIGAMLHCGHERPCYPI